MKVQASDLVATVEEEQPDGTTVDVMWDASLTVGYRVAEGWRAAREGETCRSGGGGRSTWKSVGCGKPAVMTKETRVESQNRVVTSGYCGEHCGDRVVLDDGRVAEPAEHIPGGAS